MGKELLIFLAFAGLQTLFHSGHKLSDVTVVKKISEHHWVIWIFHPVTLHAIQDYAIHFVIYSGKLIGAH
jgi:hypothetical protein